jgi:hypothetical protein
MGFEDGGVVPTEEETAQGNPNAIDPRQAMAYLAGDGAVSPEIAQALEQRIDPQGQMNPTQRATAAIGVAPDDESRFGLIQHYRTKYNGYSAAAKAALQRGDMGEAAQQATMAMDSVPNGERTQFAPAGNGLAMISRPAFGRSGGRRTAPRQQSFQGGGEVYDEDEETTQNYASAGMHGMGGSGEAGPHYRTLEDPDEDQEYARAGMGNMPPPAEPDNLNPEIPVQEPVINPQATMPTQSPEPAAAPEVVPPQTLLEMLSKGFDDQLKKAWKPFAPAAPAGAEAGVVPANPPAAPRNPMMPPAPPPRQAAMPILRPELATPLPENQVRQAYGGVLGAGEQAGANNPPVAPAAPAPQPYPDKYQAAQAVPDRPAAPAAAPAAPVTAPVTRPRPAPGPQPAAGAVIDMDEAAAGASAQGVVPTGRPRASGGQPAAGAGPDFPTYKTYDPRSSAEQMGVVPTAAAGAADIPPRVPGRDAWPTPQARRAAYERGDRTTVHPSGRDPSGAGAYSTQRVPGYGPMLREQMGDPAFTNPNYKYPGGQQPRYPSAQEAGLAAHEAARRIPNNFGNSTGTINVQTRPGSTARDFEHRGGRAPNAEEQEIERIQRAAAAAHPWVGADDKARQASIEAGIKRSDDHKKEVAKQEIIERRAAARDIANLEKTDVLERGRTDRANQLAQDNLDRDRQKQAAQMRVTQVRAKLNAASQAERDYLRHLNERMRADPSYARPENAGKLLNSAAPIMRSLKLRPEELLHAAEIAGSYDATSGTYDPKYGTGYGGPGGAAPAASEGGTYPEGIAVGTPVPYNYKGKSHTYILGPDGKTMWREDKYKEQFGGR